MVSKEKAGGGLSQYFGSPWLADSEEWPTILGQPEAESCFRDSLDELTVGNSADLTDKTQRIIQMACKHAVKGGEKVPPEELIDLIHQILSHSLPPTCPHGRPLIMTLTREELEKRFRRIQS